MADNVNLVSQAVVVVILVRGIGFAVVFIQVGIAVTITVEVGIVAERVQAIAGLEVIAHSIPVMVGGHIVDQETGAAGRMIQRQGTVHIGDGMTAVDKRIGVGVCEGQLAHARCFAGIDMDGELQELAVDRRVGAGGVGDEAEVVAVLCKLQVPFGGIDGASPAGVCDCHGGWQQDAAVEAPGGCQCVRVDGNSGLELAADETVVCVQGQYRICNSSPCGE